MGGSRTRVARHSSPLPGLNETKRRQPVAACKQKPPFYPPLAKPSRVKATTQGNMASIPLCHYERGWGMDSASVSNKAEPKLLSLVE